MSDKSKRAKGRPPKVYAEAQIVEVKPATIKCPRCGHVQKARIQKRKEGRDTHRCCSCGDVLAVKASRKLRVTE